MNSLFRFGIVSDLHIAVPQTVKDRANRFHLTEVSIPVFEKVLEHEKTHLKIISERKNK